MGSHEGLHANHDDLASLAAALPSHMRQLGQLAQVDRGGDGQPGQASQASETFQMHISVLQNVYVNYFDIHKFIFQYHPLNLLMT